VGSEMCIRDRACGAPVETLEQLRGRIGYQEPAASAAAPSF